MKISYDRERLKADIIRMLEAGRPEVKDCKLYFRDKEAAALLPSRMTDILLYTGEEKWQKLAFEIIKISNYTMCHFTPMITSRILYKYGDILPKECADKIKAYLKSVMDEFVGTELDFVGVNDNFAMMSTYAAMSQGMLFDSDTMRQEAERRLSQLKKLSKRRGVLSEYNSMTYTPLQLFVLSCIEDAAPNERLKEIARNVQKRVWADFLGHFNPGTGEFTGPSSRHYINPLQTAHKFIYTLFNPKTQMDIPDFADHSGAVEILYYLTAEYEIDDEILKLITDKQYPFEMYSTTEYCASTDATPEAAVRDMSEENDFYEYAAGVSGLYTYQTERYGVGTATNEWHNGVQTSSFMADYKPREGETKQIWCRYLLNDETKERQAFMDQGRKLAFGQKNKAVVLYKPKVAAIPAVYSGLPKFLEEHYKKQEVSGNNGVTSAKLVIVIPKDGIDKIVIGNTEITALPHKQAQPESVYIKDGDVYMAFHPLSVTDLGRDNALTITERNGRIEIALYNYSGAKKDFAKREFIHARNGFGFTINSKSEIGDFDKFAENEQKTRISDEYIKTTHSRQTYIRSVSVENDDMKLSCEYSPASEGIKNIACDDYPIEYPKLKMTGIDIEKLPYINRS